MDWIVSIAIAGIGCLLGTVFFAQSRQIMEARVQHDSEAQGFDLEGALRRRRWYWAGMIVTGIALPLFLQGFYGQLPLVIARTALLCAMLWACAWTDMEMQLIFNRVLLLGLAVRAALLAVEAAFNLSELLYTLLSALFGAAILFLMCALCRAITPGGLGWGDVKILMVLGLYLGTTYMWEALLCSLLCSFVASLVLLIAKKANRKTMIPFAPFALLGTELAAFLMGI